MRVLIADDEPLARERLAALLGEAGAELVGSAGNGEDALREIERLRPDVVLLDIRMPGRSGLSLAAALKALPSPPAVVFVSAHGEHALEAFDVEAVDYLTKPVRRDRLMAALQRARQRLQPPAPAPAGEVPVLVVHDRGRVLRLPLDEILYLKAELKYVTLRTALHTYVLDDALSDLAQRLGERFVRVHRNAIVARHAVRALEPDADDRHGEGWVVRVAPSDERLAVSRRQLAAVREALAEG